jgi:hypothetical protein
MGLEVSLLPSSASYPSFDARFERIIPLECIKGFGTFEMV